MVCASMDRSGVSYLLLLWTRALRDLLRLRRAWPDRRWCVARSIAVCALAFAAYTIQVAAVPCATRTSAASLTVSGRCTSLSAIPFRFFAIHSSPVQRRA